MNIKRIAHQYPHFTLDVEQLLLTGNKIIGLIGENGSGKTTLMSILAGHLKANQSFDVTDYRKEEVMFIPANLGLYETLTVYDFVQIVVAYSSKKPDVLALLEQLELTDKQDVKLFYLSEGMRKKLTLITLFTEDYQFLILDEPFNSIDMSYVHDLKEQLRTLAKSATILISSHILDTLNDLCDAFVYMKDGMLIKQFENIDKNILERELFLGHKETDLQIEDRR